MNELMDRAAAMDITPREVDEIAQTAHAAVRALERTRSHYWREEWIFESTADKNVFRERVIDLLERRTASVGPKTVIVLDDEQEDRLFAAIVSALDPRR